MKSTFPLAEREAELADLVGVVVGTWRLIGLASGLIALGLVISFWFMGFGIVVALLGCVVPLWFARQLALRPTIAFAAGTAVYGLALAAWLLVGADIGTTERVVSALAAFIPGATSAWLWWNLRADGKGGGLPDDEMG